MFELTEKQQEVLDFIKDFTQQHSMPPSRMEIMQNFGFQSRNAAQCHLKALEAKKMIKIVPRKARGIQLVQRELL